MANKTLLLFKSKIHRLVKRVQGYNRYKKFLRTAKIYFVLLFAKGKLKLVDLSDVDITTI